ncbi:uncharacterized protein LOC116706112 [Etheostoma spectabile]|uniref:uncharacterized protein LOC116706112 n=1 Tax=Etheostoma spectabile TaxID=54343 RepID=UPI0013AF9E37|nr:uncharacterized protein LOC116706112 [Etheostoma spectabile]
MAHAETTVSGRNFYVHLAGETNGAHQAFVEKLKDGGHTEVQSPGESDYLLVFCPNASRVDADIREALLKIPGGKPLILVVMHHTFDPDRVVAPSRRQVDNPSVLLTVDCLFYERKLLECNRNEIAWHDVQKCLGIPLSQQHTNKQGFKNELNKLRVENLQTPLMESRHEWLQQRSPKNRLKDATDLSAGVDDLRDMAHAAMTVSGRNVYVHLAGETNGAHRAFVKKLKDGGHTEVQSPGESDYLLVFCPIASQVGTDICEALDHIPGGKPAILVVMHHTFDPDRVVAPSRRQVDNPSVLLTVDCLFYERKLLECNRNEIAWHDVQKCLGIPLSQGHTMQGFKNQLKKFTKLSGKNFYVHSAGETKGAHRTFVGKLKVGGHFEVQSPGESDYLLVFCPIASRVGTDIREALDHMPGGKPAILVGCITPSIVTSL